MHAFKNIGFFAILLLLTACSAGRNLSPSLVTAQIATDQYKSPANFSFPVALSNGQSFAPAITMTQSCSQLKGEMARVKNIIGSSLPHFMAKGQAEQQVGLYYVRLSEQVIDAC